MKKYVILTSVLALAACGGGGAGAPAGVRQAITPDSAAAQSNALVTSMASEILVASDGSVATPSLSRAATQSYYNGKTYTAYRLDDVVFKIGGEDSQLKFEIDDNGQIVALTKMDRSDDFSGEPTYAKSQEGTFTRKSSTSTDFAKSLFVYGCRLDNSDIDSVVAEHFDDLEIMADTGDLTPAQIKEKMLAVIDKEINKIKESQPNHGNDEALEHARVTYKAQVNEMTSFGTPEEVHATVTAAGENVGLKYADLGFAELMFKNNEDANTIEHSYSPYVGGYVSLEVEPENLTEDATFSGTAIAGLDRKTVVNNHTTAREGVLVRDDNATLAMHSNGTSELTMNNLTVVHTDESEAELMGQKWYNMTAKQNADGTPTFIVTGENAVTNYDLPSGPTGANGITFAANEFRPTEQEYAQNTGTSGAGTRYSGNMETTMYGPNSVPSEATARFNFGNEVYSNGNADHQEVAIYGAFGGAKQ